MTTLAWVAVAEQLRRDVQNGRTGPNGELDTEAELCRRFVTSRITIRRALAELRAEGLVVSRRGSGTRAVSRQTPPVSLVIAAGRGAVNPLTLNRTAVRWRTVQPNSELAAALRRAGVHEVPKGLWLRLTYDQRANGTSFDDATIWFPPQTVPYVSRHDIAFGPTAKLIEEAGVKLGRAIQTISAGWNETRARHSEVNHDCIDLTLERIMLTVTDDIAFVSIHRHRATIACLRIELPTTNQHGDAQLVVAAL
jgi:DNA-binding GntR family transcriptional regulator